MSLHTCIVVLNIVLEKVKNLVVAREVFAKVLWIDVLEKLEDLKHIVHVDHTHEEYLELFNLHDQSLIRFESYIDETMPYYGIISSLESCF